MSFELWDETSFSTADQEFQSAINIAGLYWQGFGSNFSYPMIQFSAYLMVISILRSTLKKLSHPMFMKQFVKQQNSQLLLLQFVILRSNLFGLTQIWVRSVSSRMKLIQELKLNAPSQSSQRSHTVASITLIMFRRSYVLVNSYAAKK